MATANRRSDISLRAVQVPRVETGNGNGALSAETMVKIPPFNAGEPLSAAQWNALAETVNALWASRAEFQLVLTKGEPWRLALAPSIGNGLPDGVAPAIIGLPACDTGNPITLYVLAYY